MKYLNLGFVSLIMSLSTFAAREFNIINGEINIYRMHAFEGKELMISKVPATFSYSKDFTYCGLKMNKTILKCTFIDEGFIYPGVPFIKFGKVEASKILKLLGIIDYLDDILEILAPVPADPTVSVQRLGYPFPSSDNNDDEGFFYYNEQMGSFTRERGEFYYPLQLQTYIPEESFHIEFIPTK
jgi:hypothetical protein